MAAKKILEVKVRPYKIERDDLKYASRLFISKDSMIHLTGLIESGKPCIVEIDSETSEQPTKREAILWVSAESNLSKNVVQMTKTFQDACGLKNGDMVKIHVAGPTVPDAAEVTVVDTTGNDSSVKPIDPSRRLSWEICIAVRLVRALHVFPGMILKNIEGLEGERRFLVTHVNGQTGTNARFTPDSNVQITREKAKVEEPKKLELPSLPGLSPQVKTINSFLGRFESKNPCGMPPSNILVVHGPHGTGKTMVLRRIVSTGWGEVFRIGLTEKAANIREIFARAQQSQPSIILIDDIHLLVGSQESKTDSGRAIEAGLLEIADCPLECPQLPRVVVVASCLDYLADIPHALKDSGAIEVVSLPVPDMAGRKEILRSILRVTPTQSSALQPAEAEGILTYLAEGTHAYTGGDLRALVRKAAGATLNRISENAVTLEGPGQDWLTREAFEIAKREVHPSALHHLSRLSEKVKWEDMGGQANLKRLLKALAKSMTHGHDKITDPPKGVLLYGPPGCSKTLSARALASESGFNFISVKGPELLNMYLGESERKVRELFSRARNAAPAIIFFDEIDALATARSGEGADGDSSTRSGLQVVNALLNEMDGWEPLTGVMVMAATNRPEAIDPALLRPGRFDWLVYAPPPDAAAREAIFQGAISKRPFVGPVDGESLKELVRLTEGCSAADVVGIFRKAAIQLTIRQLDGDGDGDGDEFAAAALTMTDLKLAAASTRKSITDEVIARYKAFEAKHGHLLVTK